jgi:hypothetical protein
VVFEMMDGSMCNSDMHSILFLVNLSGFIRMARGCLKHDRIHHFPNAQGSLISTSIYTPRWSQIRMPKSLTSNILFC